MMTGYDLLGSYVNGTKSPYLRVRSPRTSVLIMKPVGPSWTALSASLRAPLHPPRVIKPASIRQAPSVRINNFLIRKSSSRKGTNGILVALIYRQRDENFIGGIRLSRKCISLI